MKKTLMVALLGLAAAITTVRADPVTTTNGWLLNVDYSSGGTRGYSLKTGFAAVGLATNDFWNFYDRDASTNSGDWRTSGTLTNLLLANGVQTTINMSVSDAPGEYGEGYSSDPMYAYYIYPLDGGNNVVTFSNLPAGQYDVLVYVPNGHTEVIVGGTSYGDKTWYDTMRTSVPVWTEGVQYARWRNVPVVAGQTLALAMHPNTQGYEILAGVQIISSVPTAPIIITQPTNQTISAVQNATMQVTAGGSGPISYQWSFNGTNIDGGTNATLTLTNVQMSQAGNYAVQLSNSYGTTNSANAVLTVMAPPICVAAAPGLVSWWRAEGNANDFVSANNGTINGGISYATGKVGQSFNFDGNTGYISVPASPTLNVGVGQGFTLECWIAPASASTEEPLFDWAGSGSVPVGAHFWLSSYYDAGGGNIVGGAGAIYANVVDTAGNSHHVVTSTGLLQAAVFQHVALTYDKVSGIGQIYFNGSLVASNNLGTFTPKTDTALVLGHRANWGTLYQGILDEPSVYNRALSAAEIAAIYNAGSAGKCIDSVPPVITAQPTGQTVTAGQNATFSVAAGGSAPLIYQWSFNGTSIVNATNATLTLTNVLGGAAGNYFVVAANLNGSVTSSVAILTVSDPTIVSQPAALTVYTGQSATFSVTAAGSSPLSYQWSFNGTNIVNATNATLTLSNVQSSQAGNYSVLVSNSYGSVNSAAATLNLLPPPPVPFSPRPGNHALNVPANTNLMWSNSTNVNSTEQILNGGFEAGSLTNWTIVPSASGTFVINNGTVDPPSPDGALPPFTGSYSALGRESGPSTFYMYQTISVPAGAAPVTLSWAHRVRNFYSSFSSSQQFQVRICDTNNNVLATAFTTNPGDTLLGSWVQTNYNMTAFAGQTVRVEFWINDQLNYMDVHVDGVSVKASAPVSIFTNDVYFGTNPTPGVSQFQGSTTNATWSLPLLAPQTTYYWQIVAHNGGTSAGPVWQFTTAGVDHFVWSPISSQQFVNQPFTAAITAQDAFNTTVSNFNGTVALTGSGVSLTPTNSAIFVNGVWSGNITIQQRTTNLVLRADDGNGHFGLSTPFNTAPANMAPVILSQPSNQTVGVGSSATFSAVADGTPSLLYQWTYNGANLANTTNSTFTLTNVQMAQAGNYAVTVSNAYGITNSIAAVLTVNPPPPAPIITSFSPLVGQAGTTVQLVGNNFSAVAASNSVYFGAVRAVVAVATTTNLTVVVPTGATYAPPTVTVNGLTAYASQSFMPTFAGGAILTTSNFGPLVTMATGSNPVGTVIADLDGDGKPDLAVADAGTHTISVFRNISTNGTLTASSFGPRVVLSAAPSSGSSPYLIVAADVDGDGKLDLVTVDTAANSVSVFRNTSTPGSLTTNSFAARVTIAVGAYPEDIAVADLDGDGHPDITTANLNGSSITILKNSSSPGVITTNSFARLDLAAGSGANSVAVVDMNGDGKPDIAVANYNDYTISIFQNNSTPGALTANSFAAPVIMPGPAYPLCVRAADLDGDGKPDLLVTSYHNQTLSVFRNLTTPGSSLTTNAYDARVDFGLGANGHTISIGDLNGDGKPDVVVDCEAPSRICIFQNLATNGSFTGQSFAPRVDLPTGNNAWGSSIGDLDGDNRPDIVFANNYDNTFSFYQSLSTFSPQLTQQPANQIVSVGQNATFSVGATGSSPLSYQWSFNGTAINNATNATLVLTNVQISQSGNYVVLVSNVVGSVSSSNAVLTVVLPPPAPIITSFSPLVGQAGTTVQLVGNNFSAVAASNSVYFGAVRAVVAAATTTNLTVVVPTGATYAPPTVTVNGLTAYASQSFMPTFAGGAILTTTNFGPLVTMATGSNPVGTVIADLDGDGKPDLAVADAGTHTISVFRNISTNGTLTASSFGPRVVLSAAPSSGSSPYFIVAADVDGDGKLDLVAVDTAANSVSVFRNTSAPGSLTTNSFAARVTIAVGANPGDVAVVDLDGDGHPDIITANNINGSSISILQNSSSPGVITSNSFARFDLVEGSGASSVAIVDMNGDGKPDIAVANYNDYTISIFQNNSTPGVLTANSFAAPLTIPGPTYPRCVRAVDLDGDGKPDLIVTSYHGQSLSVFRNLTTPGTSLTTNSFDARVEFALGAEGHIISIGDLNGDGKPDVVVDCEIPSRICIFQNLATNGSFTSQSFAPRVDLPTGYNAWGSSVGDLDGDNRPDIVFANNYDNTFSFYQNLSALSPQLTQQPANQIVSVGQNATFSVGATGNSPLSYQWSFNGTAISNATNAVLTLINAQVSQAGNYAVLVSNGAGSVTSSNATLVVLTNGLLFNVDFGAGALRGYSLKTGFAAVGTAPNDFWNFYDRDTTTTDSGGWRTSGTLTNLSLAGGVQTTVAMSVSDAAGGWDEGFSSDPMYRIYLYPLDGGNNVVTFTNLPAGQYDVLVYAPDGHTEVLVGGISYGDKTWYDTMRTSVPVWTEGVQYARWRSVPVGTGQSLVLAFHPNTRGYELVSGVQIMSSAPAAPSITNQPASGTVNVGQNATFSVGATGSLPMSYQWSFNGTTIINATNATLTLTNVQLSQAGSYAVLVSNWVGSASSSNAVLTVIPPLLISQQPASQTVNAGQSATFAVSATGMGPLNYQWSKDGGSLTIGTNTTLILTNVQPVNIGNYTVVVRDNYGNSITSSVASLSISNVYSGIWQGLVAYYLFNGNANNAAGSNLNGQTINTTSCQDRFGNTNAAYSFDGLTSYILTGDPVPIAGNSPRTIAFWFEASAFRTSQVIHWGNDAGSLTYSGVSILTNGFDLTGSYSDAIFTTSPIASNVWHHACLVFNGNIANAVCYMDGNVVPLTTSYTPSGTSWNTPSNTLLSIGLDYYSLPVNTNDVWHTPFMGKLDDIRIYNRALSSNDVVQLYASESLQSPTITAQPANQTVNAGQTACFSVGATGSAPLSYQWSLNGSAIVNATNATLTLTNVQVAQAGNYTVQVSNNAGSTNSAVAVLSIYSLPPSIITQPVNQTVFVGAAASLSVVAGGTAPLSYQWSFNGSAITNATNATLSLVNAQLTDSGSYAVQVSNAAGATNSAMAALTVVLPPVVTQQPQSQSVLSYQSASFTVSASGTGPLSYQWRKNGVNLVDGGNVSGSTSTNLTMASVSVSDAGNYDVIVSNPYATTNSSVAVLVVPQTQFSLGAASAMSGSTVVVPVLMNALGVENTFLASVGYDPTKLALQSVQLGQAVSGAYLQEVDSQTNNGYVGFAVLLDSGAVVPAGTSEAVALLTFQTLTVTSNTTVNLFFTNSPTHQETYDNSINLLPTAYLGGTVNLLPAEYAGDVYPRTNSIGDHQVTVQDWLEMGRMVSGQDSPTNSDEFLRADCAPRNAPDGLLTVADWVQAGRYALGLDPLTLVTQPATPQIAIKAQPRGGPAPARILQIGNVTAQRGQTVNVPVQLVCLTNENAVGLTVSFDTNLLKYVGATLGSAMTGGRTNINSSHPGKLGIAVAMSPGMSLASATNQILVLQFMASTNASGPANLALDSSVATLQVADKTANALTASYVDGAVVLPPQPSLVVTGAGQNLQLGWPVASGTFQVQTADNPLGPWTTIVLPMLTNGGNVSVTVWPTNQQQYYRLQGQ
jgi:hypothetical protein